MPLSQIQVSWVNDTPSDVYLTTTADPTPVALAPGSTSEVVATIEIQSGFTALPLVGLSDQPDVQFSIQAVFTTKSSQQLTVTVEGATMSKPSSATGTAVQGLVHLHLVTKTGGGLIVGTIDIFDGVL